MEVFLPPTTINPPSARADVHRSNERMLNPFTILVDTAEQHPFTFQEIYADSDRKNRLLVVTPGINLTKVCLGRHPHSLGDYSIEGFIGRVHVERKSMDDLHGTLLGWPDADGHSRRERFEQELANLSNVQCAAVVVECNRNELLDRAPEYDQGKKTSECNKKILERSIRAYMQDYGGVSWVFCDGRRDAEVETFRWLERFYRKHKKELKAKVKT